MAGNTSTPGASVVSRLLAVLYAFDEQHPRLTLTQLARRAGLPVPTAYRFAGELVAGGALARRPSGEYVIGRRLWDVGVLAPVHTGLREIASPFLNDIHAATRATVHLAIRDGIQVLYVDRLAGRASVPVVSTIGSRLPMHSTGVGKVLLAHAPDDVQEQVLADLSRVTPYTITQPNLLRQQLARIRRDGYATTAEEMALGACSIAVPIRTRTSGDAERWPVVAAVGIVVASLKRDKTRLLTALQVAAQGISRSLTTP
ncbi:IclR family transcriptional regulator [Phytoactinopolyspora mesophila]|uniref:Helix-turn-helix domain-containing protein n=1 Tax=Phytoactinopolyspora mesophila TaxID=2650750 RepID=A0A7K3LZH5_9ACTN|nr:IclR family transcriptional regulator [Phytoactinopolyspora mesophila]NDL56426.1 helix-turn-helix domain-containing protein [Phytoactinopolyspora mesophila]